MQATPAIVRLSLVILLGLLACGWCWLIALARIGVTFGWISGSAATAVGEALRPLGIPARLPLVTWSPRRAALWAAVDLGGLFVLWFGLSLGVQLVLLLFSRAYGWKMGSEQPSLPQQQALILANVGLSLAILGIGLPLIALRTGAKPRDFGWSLVDVWRDVRLGLIGLVMLAPPVYALQALLVTIWKPSAHPLIEMFKETPDRSFFVVLFVAAAIVAPLFEELIFRVIFQGFLERAFTHTGPLHDLLFDPPRPGAEVVQCELVSPANEPSALALGMPAAADINPYAPPRSAAEPLLPSKPTEVLEQPELRGPPAWCSIAISSVVFALLHYSHGPDWVPLIFLAAGMGYLYQRTHRLIPSLIVHCGLNSLSMWMLWVHIYEGLGK